MLEAADLSAGYGKARVIEGLSLAVPKGAALALLGRNGAGKTTLLKALMQVIRPTGGTVRLDGRDITGQPPHRVARAGLGWVPEDRRIFTQLTVRENLEVGRQPPRAGAPDWREEAIFALFPNLAERRDAPGRSLSGGEQQMLAIGRTLMGNPACLLLDEPSEGIAPVIVEAMAVAVRRMTEEGLTVLVAEQTVAFARAVADRVAVLDGGRLRFDGTFAELDRRSDLRESLLGV